MRATLFRMKVGEELESCFSSVNDSPADEFLLGQSTLPSVGFASRNPCQVSTVIGLWVSNLVSFGVD